MGPNGFETFKILFLFLVFLIEKHKEPPCVFLSTPEQLLSAHSLGLAGRGRYKSMEAAIGDE